MHIGDGDLVGDPARGVVVGTAVGDEEVIHGTSRGAEIISVHTVLIICRNSAAIGADHGFFPSADLFQVSQHSGGGGIPSRSLTHEGDHSAGGTGVGSHISVQVDRGFQGSCGAKGRFHVGSQRLPDQLRLCYRMLLKI